MSQQRLWLKRKPTGTQNYTTRISGPANVVSAGPSLGQLEALPDHPTVWVNKAIFHPLAASVGPRPIWHTHEEGNARRCAEFRDRVEGLGCLVWGKIPRHWDQWHLDKAELDFHGGPSGILIKLGLRHFQGFQANSAIMACLLALLAGASYVNLYCADMAGDGGYLNQKKHKGSRWKGERLLLERLQKHLPIRRVGPGSTSSPPAPASSAPSSQTSSPAP